MTLTALLNQTVMITRRIEGTATDRFGNEIPGEDAVETAGWLQPLRSTEPGADGEFSVSDFTLFLLAGTEIRTGDRATVDGVSHEVIGAPADWLNPRTQVQSYVQATVRRTAASWDEGS